MLGVSHATSGAALGLAVAGYAPRLAGIEPSAGTILTFADYALCLVAGRAAWLVTLKLMVRAVPAVPPPLAAV